MNLGSIFFCLPSRSGGGVTSFYSLNLKKIAQISPKRALLYNIVIYCPSSQ